MKAHYAAFARYNAWTRDDTRWMGAWRSVINNDEERVPEAGRYNAGQKLYFWLMSLFILVLFLTGLVMWDRYFFPFTSIPPLVPPTVLPDERLISSLPAPRPSCSHR